MPRPFTVCCRPRWPPPRWRAPLAPGPPPWCRPPTPRWHLAPPLPPQVLAHLEREARRLATEVDSLVEGLAGLLQAVSALTVETVEAYRDGVCKTCDEVDNNIKAMYQLMAKWEELNKNMAPAYRVANQIKDIKRLLEMFEAALG